MSATAASLGLALSARIYPSVYFLLLIFRPLLDPFVTGFRNFIENKNYKPESVTNEA